MTGSMGSSEDIEIIAGNDHPLAMWQFLVSEHPDVLFPLDELDDFSLMVRWPGTEIIRNTIDHPQELAVDISNSIVTWAYTLAHSRALPQGRIARYELERWRHGKEQTFIAGRMIASLGNNADEALDVNVLVDEYGRYLEEQSGIVLTE